MLEWAAERQADILLYLGALLLSVSALLFVAYQGGALAGLARFVILSGYTIGFIVLGLVLHRWERVREAGPVFLLVGALLVPLQFVALRTQVLDEATLPNNVLWLLGSTVAGGFYYVLVWRGLGRLYVIPAVLATYLAWGSLAWVLGLPDEWYGVWFIGLVLPVHLAAVREMGSGQALGRAARAHDRGLRDRVRARARRKRLRRCGAAPDGLRTPLERRGRDRAHAPNGASPSLIARALRAYGCDDALGRVRHRLVVAGEPHRGRWTRLPRPRAR